MSENVELVRRSLLATNDPGVEALIENFDPAVEFHAPKESMNPRHLSQAQGVAVARRVH
jgi:hypothetical protein